MARSSLAAALAVALALGCTRRDAPLAIESDGMRAELALAPFSLTLRAPSGDALLTTLSESAAAGPYGAPGATLDQPTFVGQALSGWDGYRPHEGPWLRGRNARLLDRTPASARLLLGEGAEVITLSLSLQGARARLELDSPATRNKSGIAFVLPGDEHFFGLGERFASLDHRGRSLYSWAEEGGLGAGESAPASADNPYPNGPSMTWFPVPFLLSSKGYGVFVDSSARLEWHLGDERPDAWRLAADARRFALTVYAHAQPLDTLRDYTEDTGRAPAPAPWAFGPRREIGQLDQARGTDEWRALRLNHVPTTSIDDNTHFLPARSELGREDQLRAWTAQLHAAGYKVLGYYTPYISQTFASAAQDYSAGLKNGWFVRGVDGQPVSTFFSSGAPQNLATIDLTNPAAVDWFKSLLARSLALGYDGWMHDFGEYLPRDAQMFDGRSGAEVHNEFPLLSARAARDLLDQEKPGDSFYYVRSGFAGTQGVVPGVWSGDPEASFDETTGLPANLRAGLSAGMSGVPYWGSDIGGYKCLTDAPHDKEMYLRWTEVGALSPLMMNDTACFTLSGSAQKWTLWSDDETVQVYARWARLHTRMQPYWLALAREAAASGRPLMIHPFLLFPNAPEAQATDDSFFVGRALFAAPVVRRGLVARDVWLPPGRYVDGDSFITYSGGQRVSLPAPLDALPLLFVEGQLLPLLDDSVETLAPASDGTVDARSVSDRLDVRVALAAGSTASLVLADGTLLTASRGSAPSSDGGGLSAVTADQLPVCASCYLAESIGDVDRLRANGSMAVQSSLAVQDVRLSASGGPPRRVRWDVLRLR